jgi:purine-binding chemotaxis protein CheW
MIATAQMQTQYLTFAVVDAEYGVGILQAREIIEVDTITVVPNAPAFVRGVINLRGSVVPVVDLAVKFGRPASVLTRKSCIVVVEVEGEEGRSVVGLLVDRVSQVADFAPEAIESAPDFGTGVRTDWLLGLGRVDKRFVLLLDADRMLGARDLPAALAESARAIA